jgi:MFS transporter, UMF1 family
LGIKGDKKVINAWIFYDWANSAYNLVITTAIFPIYFAAITSGTDGSGTLHLFGMTFVNSALYSYTLALSFLIVAFISPLLSGIADYTGKKKFFLKLFCYTGAFSCAMLYFFSVEYLALGLLCVMGASIGFWGSTVFYNAFLPEIAETKEHDKVSARGFAMGYLGSSLLLILNLILVMNPDLLGITDKSLPPKIAFISVGLWWAGFAQITFNRLPENIHNRKPEKQVLLKGFQELKKVWNELKKTVRLKRFLLAYFVYNTGVQTVMLMATLFASKEINISTEGLIVTVLIIQFVAMFGAHLFSYTSSKLGNFNTLAIAISIWIGICIYAYFITSEAHFYLLAGITGLVMGGIQALSRSTYSKILPETIDHASYFSFYDVCEKIGIVIGMSSYGFITEFTGSMRNAIIALITFFAIGLITLYFVPKTEATVYPNNRK